jgi:hypothetical protein
MEPMPGIFLGLHLLSDTGPACPMVPALTLQEGETASGSVPSTFPGNRGQAALFQVRLDVLLRVCLVKKQHRGEVGAEDGVQEHPPVDISERHVIPSCSAPHTSRVSTLGLFHWFQSRAQTAAWGWNMMTVWSLPKASAWAAASGRQVPVSWHPPLASGAVS